MLSAFPDLSVASARRTLLPRAGRVAVARDPGLGGGNLWHTALAHSRDPDAPLVVADPPVPGVDASTNVSGETHSALPAVSMSWVSVTCSARSFFGSTWTWSCRSRWP